LRSPDYYCSRAHSRYPYCIVVSIVKEENVFLNEKPISIEKPSFYLNHFLGKGKERSYG